MTQKSTEFNKSIIEIQELSKCFRSFCALDNISLTVPSGQILGLLGPNGAGKTTLLHILLGLTTPSHGKISIFGLDLRKQRRKILERVNFSSAYISLPTNLSVWENLYIFSKLYAVKNAGQTIRFLLELFEIGHMKNALTGALSSGQLTRVNLCKALLNDPEVLFLDEPTASLDPDIADKVQERILKIHREHNLTIIYTSHDMQEIQKMCQQVVFLSQGKIVIQGTPEHIISNSKSSSLEAFFIRLAREQSKLSTA